MLSLPLIAPQNEYMLFLSPHLRPFPADDTDSSNQNLQQQQRQQQQQRRPNASQNQNRQQTRHSLAQLQSDESSIAQRKHNIRQFGAGWIKPPGITKTMQAELEERAEREEQMAIERREQMLADMQAQQEADEARQRAEEAGGEEAEEEGERDLDDEIPDAEDEEEEDEDEDEEDESGYPETSEVEDTSGMDPAAEGDEGEVTFNDESLLEGSFLPGDEERDRIQQERYARLEEAELTGIAQDEAELGIERDLDDSVPEAGEYEHTDTELMETTSEEDEDEDEEEEGEEEEEDEGEEAGNDASELSEVRPRSLRRSNGRTSLVASLGARSVGRQSNSSSQNRRSLRERQVRISGSERSLRSGDVSISVSSLLESSFMDSSPVVGRLRSGNNRGNNGHL